MSSSNKTEGYVMKKISIALLVIMSMAYPVSASSAEDKSVVIIDSYFNSTKFSNVVDVCVAKIGCDLVPVQSKILSDATNHGTAMAEIVKKQNPNAKLILIRSASTTKNTKTGQVSVGTLNANDFIAALGWVNNNSGNVKAVSFSYNLSGNGCKPSSSGGVNVRTADNSIRSLVEALNSKGILVFASTGNNGSRTTINYPACIDSVASVSAGINGNPDIQTNHTDSVDYIGSLSNVYNYTSSIYGLLPQTSSSATAAVVGQLSLLTSLSSKVVVVNQ